MVPEKFSRIVAAQWVKTRLDAYLARCFEGQFSRTELKRVLEEGLVRVNGKQARARDTVREGDQVEGVLPQVKPSDLVGEAIDLRVIHEDASVLIIDKPAGMVVHPGAGNRSGTLVHALLGRHMKLSEGSGPERPGIVHRLDKETSGILVVAKTNVAHQALARQFSEHSLTKIYYALVHGRVRFEEGRIEEPIGRHPEQRIKMAVRHDDRGKPAETRWRVLKRFAAASYLEIQILTGRTHQIRVHLAHAGHPVLGDRVYASPSVARLAPRPMLHAARIEFLHPKSGKLVKFESPLPDDFVMVLERQI